MGSLQRAVNVADLRRMARARLPRVVFDYLDGGAEDERTLRDNVRAFRRWNFRPRHGVKISGLDLSVTVMGQKLVLNVESHGFRVSVYNRTGETTDAFVAAHPSKHIVPTHSLAEFVQSLVRPRKVMLMVKAGSAPWTSISTVGATSSSMAMMRSWRLWLPAKQRPATSAASWWARVGGSKWMARAPLS